MPDPSFGKIASAMCGENKTPISAKNVSIIYTKLNKYYITAPQKNEPAKNVTATALSVIKNISACLTSSGVQCCP